MTARLKHSPPPLYERDETAWLDQTASLIHDGRQGEIEFHHLGEFLTDMARRDRREVTSRLVVLLAHLLKWTYQPEQRSGGWKATILTQQSDLAFDLQSGTLKNHAVGELASCYRKAVKIAVAETGLNEATFPIACPYSIDQLHDESIVDGI